MTLLFLQESMKKDYFCLLNCFGEVRNVIFSVFELAKIQITSYHDENGRTNVAFWKCDMARD